MDQILAITIGFALSGYCTLLFIKRDMKIHTYTNKQKVWFIIGTVVWGVGSILLIVSWFYTHAT